MMLYICFGRGRNVEGQCGVESLPLVTRPTPLLELHGAPVVSVHAGKLNSGAVLSSGEAWSWGEGKSGKLGHGNTDNVKSPARVRAQLLAIDLQRVPVTSQRIRHHDFDVEPFTNTC